MRVQPAPDPLQRRAQQLLPAFLATCMSAFVAAVVTAINTGMDGGLVARWWHAWLRAWPAAVIAAYLFRPLAWWAALRVARLAAARDAGPPLRQAEP
jgi:ABC-type antimicrobial peptide transport system permease subunit